MMLLDTPTLDAALDLDGTSGDTTAPADGSTSATEVAF